MRISLLIAFVLVAICFSQVHHDVPCKSEVIFEDYYGKQPRKPWKQIAFSSDASFKSLNKFSISFWAEKAQTFNIKLSSKVYSSSLTATTLFQMEVDSSNTISILSDLFPPPSTPPLPSSPPLAPPSNGFNYFFLTFDIGTPQQICTFTCSQDKGILKKCYSIITNFSVFSFDVILLDSNIADTAKTSTIYLHRNYGIEDILPNYENTLLMMQREDSRLTGIYLFNQKTLQDYIVENGQSTQSNIIITNQPQTSIPTHLLDTSMKFEKNQYLRINGFSLSSWNREFQISLYIKSNIESTVTNPYTVFEIQDISSNSIIKFQLKNMGDVFYDSVFIYPETINQNLINGCQVPRQTWSNVILSGFYQYRIDPLNTKLYLQIIIDSNICLNNSNGFIDLTADVSNYLASDLLYLVLGSTSNSFTENFMIKTVRLYEGSYSPVLTTACYSTCDVLQRRSPSSYENDKLQYLQQIPTPILSYVSDSPALNILTIQSTYSLTCIDCSPFWYSLDDYCLPGGSSWNEQIDVDSSSCRSDFLCTDPLNSSDCIQTCKDGFSFGTTTSCGVQCNYDCKSCDSSNEKNCISSPSTRLPITTPPSTSNPCNSGYIDDGISLQCIFISATLYVSGTTSTIIGIFDVKYTLQAPKWKVSLNQQNIKNPSSPITQSFSNASSELVIPDIDEGMQYYSTQFSQISSLSSLYSMKIHFKINGNLGRMVHLVSLYSKLTPTKSIILIILEQYNEIQYSFRVCFQQRCQSPSVKNFSINSGNWYFLSYSIFEGTDFFNFDFFLNAQVKSYRFSKHKASDTSDFSQGFGIKFGSTQNNFSTRFDYFAIRYITFIDGPIISISQQKSQLFNQNCVLHSNDLCILCAKGYKLKSYLDLTCVLQNDPPLNTIPSSSATAFYFSALKMDHYCVIDTQICTQCKDTPSSCQTCQSPREPPKCSCPDGKYSDSSENCVSCSLKCTSCSSATACTVCSVNRINLPSCDCPSGFIELSNQQQCKICDSSCQYCDTSQSKCICPNLQTTHRHLSSNNLSCPCNEGFYDAFLSSKICQPCFGKQINYTNYQIIEKYLIQSCSTCISGEENQCLSCKLSSTNSISQVNILKNDPNGLLVGTAICYDSTKYLDFEGNCSPYVTLDISLVTHPKLRYPRIKLTLSEPIEKSDGAQWLNYLQISLVSPDLDEHKRFLQSTSNLILTISNDDKNPNVGYIDVSVVESCRVVELKVLIKNYKAIRNSKGVPLGVGYQDKMFRFPVGPFILVIDDDELKVANNLDSYSQSLQSNGAIAVGRFLSFFLIIFNCLQAITPLLFINTYLPIKAYYFVSYLSSYVISHTRPWIIYERGNEDYTKDLIPYEVYSKPIVTSIHSYRIVREMGISASFLINIVESGTLILLIVVVLLILKILNESNQEGLKNQKHYLSIIPILIYSFEARLIYILLAFFLQLQSPNFQSALGVISCIVCFICILLFMYGMRSLYQTLNSKEEKEDFNYQRVRHLIQFLDIEKHKLVLNYKLISLGKKILTFAVLIFFQSFPKAVIALEIIIAILGLLLDFITRPYTINWISYLRVASSISYLGIWVSVLVSYNSLQDIYSQSTFIIPSSVIKSYQSSGNAIFYLLIIYISFNLIIFLLKSLSVTHSIYKWLINRDRKEVVLMCEKLRNDGETQKIQFALLNQSDLYSSSKTSTSQIFAQSLAVKPGNSQKERFLFNVRKPNNLVKPTNLIKL